MRAVGIDYDIIVDMFDYTWDLFDDIHKAIGRGDQSESVLLETMNDENKSNSIVYHIKVCPTPLSQYMSLTNMCTDDDQFIHAAATRPL